MLNLAALVHIEGFPLFVMCDTVDNKAIVNAEIGKWNKQEKLKDVRAN